ncbi:MAG TPA: hypothetical protein VFV22_02395 [Candidatus Paceibacterota bacterium]|nr:hypothetical protein [Candidatus Paceibacterota bacterium]
MRILFISQELIGSGLCHRLIREGNEVKLYINDPARKRCLDGFVEKVDDWKKELRWVGKDGLIVFDDVGFGKLQDSLRKKGYSVFGGNAEGDRLELDRGFAQRVMHNHKIKILPSFNFKTIDAAIDFVNENKGKWVVKQTTHISVLNYVGEKDDGSDVVKALNRLKKQKIHTVHLQKKVDGVEVGIARYFNGSNWVGPIEINHEHKRLRNGDKGPLTAEMGTVMWHSTDESLPLYEHTLKKLTPHLQKIGYRGDIDVNCIATKDQIWPLELTPRLGTPAIQLHTEMYESSFANFLHSIANGENTELSFKKGYGVVVAVAVPPFPYPPKTKENKTVKQRDLLFSTNENVSVKDLYSIYLEEISLKKNKRGEEVMYWAGEFGYAGYVTSVAGTIPKAHRKAMKMLSHINLPKMIYRTDIGERVHKHDLPQLKKWGWV